MEVSTYYTCSMKKLSTTDRKLIYILSHTSGLGLANGKSETSRDSEINFLSLAKEIETLGRRCEKNRHRKIGEIWQTFCQTRVFKEPFATLYTSPLSVIYT